MSEIVKRKFNKIKYRQHIAAICAAGGGFTLGTIVGWSSPSYEELAINFKPTEISWVYTIMILSSTFVSLPASFLVDRFGRKKMILFMLIPLIMGWSCIIFGTESFNFLLVGRLLVGLTLGINSITVPIYNGEIADKEIRGNVISYGPLMMNIGILFTYTVGTFFSIKFYSLIVGITSILLTIGLILFPESPTYLIKKQKYEAAKKALRFFKRPQNAFDEIKTEIESNNGGNQINWGEVIKRRASYRGFLIVFSVVLTLQMSGINVILYYTADIFKMGKIPISPNVATIIVGAATVFSNFFNSQAVDRLGRRVLLIFSISMMGLSNLSIAVYYTNIQVLQDYVSWLPVVGLCVYIITYSIGIGSITWILAGEMFASDIRSYCGSALAIVNALSSFFVTFFFDLLRESIGIGYVFYIYFGFCLVGLSVFLLFVPETKEMSFDEIQHMLAEGPILILNQKKRSHTLLKPVQNI